MPYSDAERRRSYGREWMKRNPERARAGMRRWRAAHPDEHRKDNRTYYARRRDYLIARQLAYFAAHPEVRRASAQNYRSRKANAGGSFTSSDWKELLKEVGARCAYCGSEGPLVVEHRIPLSRGGTNSIDNLLPSCTRCNNRKHRLTEEEFRARLTAENAERTRRRAE